MEEREAVLRPPVLQEDLRGGGAVAAPQQHHSRGRGPAAVVVPGLEQVRGDGPDPETSVQRYTVLRETTADRGLVHGVGHSVRARHGDQPAVMTGGREEDLHRVVPVVTAGHDEGGGGEDLLAAGDRT